ncbi:O-antigen translocase [Paraherbaspirillum soli]|uniref:O-antigen translocase n=1 Tax=Paraherbaspirillum soli TaxID=631222 RepID=A0ABW0MFV5_9BURK
MHFLKVGLLFSASTLSKLLAGLIVVKIIAVYIGASGLGRLGQFMSLTSMVAIMAGGGITTGVVKYVAEFKDNGQELKEYLAAASLVTILASLLLGAVLILLAPVISEWLLKTSAYADVIRVLAVAQFSIACTNLLMGLVNGHKRVNAFAIINTLGVAIGAAGVAIGCTFYGIKGAMYGLIWMPACPILLLLPWYRLGLQFEWRWLLPVWDRGKVRKFMGFSLMLLVTVFSMQMAQIVIRYIIEARNSWVEVGYWQAVTRISEAYLQFITVVLANYYLPRLAELRQRSEIKKEVNLVYKYAMPVLVLMGSLVFFCRDWIILLLFSREFLPMKEFFTWQLVGDAFKVAAYIGAYVAVARAKTVIYITAEIYQAGMLVSLCYFLVGKYGAVGATYAYCINYILYFVIVQLVLRTYLHKADNV